MSTLETVIVKLFPLLVFLGLISPLVAFLFAFVFYFRHRDRVEPERRVPGVAYVLAVIVCGVIAGYFGLIFGIKSGLQLSDFKQSLRFMGLLRYRAAHNGSGNFPCRVVALSSAACVAKNNRNDLTGQPIMSALPPKADMCSATRDVRFVPIADIT